MRKLLGWLILILLILTGGFGFIWWLIEMGWILIIAALGMLSGVIFLLLFMIAINLIWE